MKFLEKIRKSSALLVAAMTLAQLPAAAFADCTAIYQGEAKRLRTVDYTGYRHIHDPASNTALLISGALFVIPGAITGALSTTDMIRAADREKTVRLLSSAKSGDSLELLQLADDLETTSERAAEVVNELNTRDAFCVQGRILSYSEVTELVRLKLKTQK